MKVGLSLAVVVLLAAGCSEPREELLVETSSSQTRYDRDGAMTMAAGALDELDLDEGMVVVPTDEAIFALDADALADLLSGGLADLVAGSVISIDYGPSAEDWPLQLGDGSGPSRTVTRTGETWSIDGQPVVDVWRRDGITVVVVDGVLDR